MTSGEQSPNAGTSIPSPIVNLPEGVWLSDTEVQALASLGMEATVRRGTSPGLDYGLSEDEREAQKRELERLDKEELEARNRAAEKLREELARRLASAYEIGAARAIDQEAKRAYNVRSAVLLGVVLAVVIMPIVAIIADIDPQAFGTYIAPVTAIAGTVVGYWFGSVDR